MKWDFFYDGEEDQKDIHSFKEWKKEINHLLLPFFIFLALIFVLIILLF